MSIDLEKVIDRNIKLDESRYGISLVALFYEDKEVINYVNYLVKEIEFEFPGYIRWIKYCNLHSTIIRGRSISHPIKMKSSRSDDVINILSAVPEFEVNIGKPILHTDGVIRVNISDRSLLGFIDEDVRLKIAKNYNCNVETQNNHWIALGSLRNIDRNDIDCIHRYFGELSNDNQFSGATEISTLSIVYYEDIEFRTYALLESIKLKGE